MDHHRARPRRQLPGSYARNTGHPTREGSGAGRIAVPELALQFLPRLDPLARALQLTLQGAHEEITVDLEIGTR